MKARLFGLVLVLALLVTASGAGHSCYGANANEPVEMIDPPESDAGRVARKGVGRRNLDIDDVNITFNVSYSTVGKWKRFEVSYPNSTWSGNPFDLVLDGVFTHTTSGETKTIPGFYAGSDTWKLFFMPDKLGEWTYITESPDNDLNGKTGFFTCIESGLPGKLEGDGNRWRLTDAGPDFPIIWNIPIPPYNRHEFRSMDADDPALISAVNYASDTVGARIVSTGGALFLKSTGWASSWPQDAMPYVDGQEGDTFYLPFWDNLNAKMDRVRDAGMGCYIMIYSDDEMSPNNYGITAQSQKEMRLFRYTIARLAGYPIILWDTGIDIGEYRSNTWIDWFTDWFLANDPWQHPVSSRTGGGSGGKFPVNATYYSAGGAGNGGNDIPSRSSLLSDFNSRLVPTAYTDHWRPFISRGNWDIHSLRRVTWRCGLTGSQSLFPDYNAGTVVESELEEGAPYIGHAARFFRQNISDIAALDPHDELLTAGSNVILSADISNEYVIYDKDGGSFSVNLSDVSGTFNVEWFNPRDGSYSGQTTTTGGGIRTFTATDTNDWVLHITRAVSDTTPPAITSVTAATSTSVSVVFSEPVEESSAENTSNYEIDNGITINSAMLGSDEQTVTLTTSQHSEGVTYTLTVNNIKDRASTPNTIAPDTQKTYSLATQLEITNLTVNSGKSYEVAENLQIGDLVYIDRAYTFSSIPDYLQGETYIRTANADKSYSGDSFLSFDVNRDVAVYIAHDNRVSPKPTWMNSFTDTGASLATADTTLTAFAKDFSAGTVTLGGNEGGDYSMYSVIIVSKGTTTTTTLALSGTPANQSIHLCWTVTGALPPTSTWQIAYDGPAGDQLSPITSIISPTRAYTLTGLANYTWYTVTLNGMLDSTAFLTDTARVMPTDIFVYLPLVLRTYGP